MSRKSRVTLAKCSKVDYAVEYNKNGVLAIRTRTEFGGLQSSMKTYYRLINVVTGARITTETAFRSEKIPALVAKLDALLQAGRGGRGIATGSRREPAAAEPEVRGENLDDMELGDLGITFAYDYAFPSASRTDPPPGRFFLAFAALSDALNPSGPLAAASRAR